MLSGQLWPAHPQPLPDELFSSWIVRVAEANGIKFYTLMFSLFGHRLNPWHLDVDRLAPESVLTQICLKTGLSYSDAQKTTLSGYRTILYDRQHLSGQMRWILPIGIYGSKRKGFGLQYCPECLAADSEPYFRRSWRVGFCSFCERHETMLHDSCHNCGASVVLHRRDIGRNILESKSLAHCPWCDANYSKAPQQQVKGADGQTLSIHKQALISLNGVIGDQNHYNLGFFAILHQLCKVLGSEPNGGRLYHWVNDQLGTCWPEPFPRRCTFESRRIAERHALVSLAFWLLDDLPSRLTAAWQARAIRFNHLLKDFEQPPRWYVELCMQFNRGTTSWKRGIRTAQVKVIHEEQIYSQQRT